MRVFENENVQTKVIRKKAITTNGRFLFFEIIRHNSAVAVEDGRTINAGQYRIICLLTVIQKFG